MVSRTNLLVIGLFIAGVVAIFAGLSLLGGASPLELQIFLVATSPTFFVAAYWSFIIWRRLPVRLYRNQALGIGLVSMGYGQFLLDGLFVPFPVRFGIAQFTLMYWVDSSVLAARRSDPLLREVLGWRRTRFLPWGLLVVSFLAFLLQNPMLSHTLGFIVFEFTPWISALVMLPIAARRTGDMQLKSHLQWFGLTAAVAIAGVIIESFVPTTPTPFPEDLPGQLYGMFVLFVAGFCLYRSARSLVPLNKMSFDEQ